MTPVCDEHRPDEPKPRKGFNWNGFFRDIGKVFLWLFRWFGELLFWWI